MGKWNDKNVREEALKYNRKCDFQKYSNLAYQYAWRHNLLKDYDWFITEDNIKRCIYVYIDEENKYAYVGVTSNKEQRHIAHKTGMFNKHIRDNSPVYKHFTFIGKDVPDPIYLEDDIMGSALAQEREDYWKKKYEEIGYKMLNLGPTGVGKGSLGIGKWNDETVREEARKYNSKTEFYNGCRGAYDYAKRKGMLNDLFENIRIYWTEQSVSEEAKKYKSKSDFLRYNPGAYDYAYNHHMLDDLFGKTFHWTDDSVREEAKKYKSKSEFYKESAGAYMYAKKHNMLDDLFNNLINYIDVNDVKDKASKCDSRKEFKNTYKRLYEYAVRHHILNNLFPKN